MSKIQESNFSQMKSFIESNEWPCSEEMEGDTNRLNVKHGKHKCTVKVYSTGTIQLQGKPSNLQEALKKVKEAIENEEAIGEILPFDIEKFPETLQKCIPDIDPIIIQFIKEAIISIKAGSNLGCAFLLGGASEKAIYLLIDAYTNAIKDETLRGKFKTRVSGKCISKVFDSFKNSYKSSKNKPNGMGWTNDLEIKIDQIFQFCRICRNESGHPHLLPNLDKGALLANMGQFVKYIKDLYEMIEYYKKNEVEL